MLSHFIKISFFLFTGKVSITTSCIITIVLIIFCNDFHYNCHAFRYKEVISIVLDNLNSDYVSMPFFHIILDILLKLHRSYHIDMLVMKLSEYNGQFFNNKYWYKADWISCCVHFWEILVVNDWWFWNVLNKDKKYHIYILYQWHYCMLHC